MDPIWRVICFAVAFALFAVEAIYRRSVVAGGLAVFTIPFLWDAAEAA